MAVPDTFHFTSHSRNRGRERAVTLEQFKETVEHPDSKAQQFKGEHNGFVYLFKKKIGARTLNVVAEVFKNECWFVTGYWT